MQVLLGCFKKVVVSEQWSFKAGGLLVQVVSNTGLTIYMYLTNSPFTTRLHLLTHFQTTKI